MRLSLHIRPLSVPEVFTQVGVVEDGYDTTFFLPEDVLDISTMEVELNWSIAGNLLSGLEFLTGFPYGCVEQIMSKALPNATVGRALIQSGASDPVLLTNLEPKILSGLQMLYAMQHSDGGWGWWRDDQSSPYQSAYVLQGLHAARQAEINVEGGVYERGMQFLQNFTEKELDKPKDPTLERIAP